MGKFNKDKKKGFNKPRRNSIEGKGGAKGADKKKITAGGKGNDRPSKR
jgi:hypothetical protein